MSVTRQSDFEANVTSPVIAAALAGRPYEDIVGIAKEVLMFACPVCGHITPDHRWAPDLSGNQGCLKDGCECNVNFDSFSASDNFDLEEDILSLFGVVVVDSDSTAAVRNALTGELTQINW